MPKPTRRLAIVTGTSSGIGEALARQLLEGGWHVIGLARKAASIVSARYQHVAFDLAETGRLKATLDEQIGPAIADPGISRLGLVNNAADPALLGQVDQLDPAAMQKTYGVNTVAPVLLMGWMLHNGAREIPLRIVNVSSGAAVDPYPGLGAYGATKAALRMTAMVFAMELDARFAAGGASRDVSICSYEPGVVDTPMQVAVRASSAETVPIVGMFLQLAADGRLLPPNVPARPIVQYLETDGHPRFSEQRFLP